MWNLLLNDEQKMMGDSVRAYFARELPIERLKSDILPCDIKRVRAGMAELGWFGVGVPESVGGAGLDLVEEMLVQRECGRYLIGPSFLATVLAAHVAFHAGDAALAGEFVAGTKSAALGIQFSATSHNDPNPTYVFDWESDDLLLVWNDEGMGLFDKDALSQVRPETCLDEILTMHAGLLALSHSRHWVSARQAPLTSRAQVLLAAALIGLAEHACDLTIDHVKVREQFGKPIASFQAVKHRCADMGVRWRLGWYQTSLACLKVQAATQDASLQASAAKLVAAQAAHENGRAAIQLHGGVGYQSECAVHRFMKRAHVYDQAGGCMQIQARRIASAPSLVW
jgi:alkylation response protein AidB-like acyl-CoA dehydrogenase